jgi:hypothetical protein
MRREGISPPVKERVTTVEDDPEFGFRKHGPLQAKGRVIHVCLGKSEQARWCGMQGLFVQWEARSVRLDEGNNSN